MYHTLNCGIYIIENIINGKCYVGSSVSITRRWYSHKSELNRGVHENSYLQHSWDKYGASGFVFSVLESCLLGDFVERETWWVNLLGTLHRDRGYNLKAATGSGTYSDETRAKISATGRGKIISQEQRAKLSAAAKGRQLTPEHRAKIGASRRGKPRPPEVCQKLKGRVSPMLGKKMSPESRAKLSAAQRERWANRKHQSLIAE